MRRQLAIVKDDREWYGLTDGEPLVGDWVAVTMLDDATLSGYVTKRSWVFDVRVGAGVLVLLVELADERSTA